MTQNEIYLNCVEKYEISNLGNVRRKLKCGEYKQINGSVANNGYRYFQLQRNEKRCNFYFHHMVAKCFLQKPTDKKYVIDHIDRNKINNSLDNLRYVTYKENSMNSNFYLHHISELDPIKRKKLIYHFRKSKK